MVLKTPFGLLGMNVYWLLGMNEHWFLISPLVSDKSIYNALCTPTFCCYPSLLILKKKEW